LSAKWSPPAFLDYFVKTLVIISPRNLQQPWLTAKKNVLDYRDGAISALQPPPYSGITTVVKKF
jgi:hypothetical protein